MWVHISPSPSLTQVRFITSNILCLSGQFVPQNADVSEYIKYVVRGKNTIPDIIICVKRNTYFVKEILNISNNTLNKCTYIEYETYEIKCLKSKNPDKEISVHVFQNNVFLILPSPTSWGQSLFEEIFSNPNKQADELFVLSKCRIQFRVFES